VRVCTPHCGLAPETTSGGETYERELLERLGRAGVRLEIILARGKPHRADVPNWTVHRFGIGRGLRWYVAPLVVPAAIRRVYEAVGFDLLRVHSLRYIGPSALAARRWYGLDVPVVSHHHHLDPSPLNRLIEKRVVNASDRVVVGSEFARRQLREELGARTDHVSVVYYGVDPRFTPRPPSEALRARYGLVGRRVVLFFGGLKPRKNLGLLLEAWQALAPRHPDTTLLVAGGGSLLPELRARASRLGLDGRVVFTGYVAEAEKPEHFNLGDVFFFPSAMEGFGLTVAEAMSSGLPVVASNRGSIPELVVEGEGGFVCDPTGPGPFVEKLSLILSDQAIGEKFGRANRERVERMFRWERCVDGTRRVYETALEEWRRRADGGHAR
jgi:glycosyltransferase involved in cell wall biosynthesis